ncbi:MAG: hypothetical protein EDX89_05640 [Acidobacteria bacterium]|nr:MAG: hypothetical protein EDX89_05640 [Acidobacteriota bacterium]MCE7956347.1 hypothetical protein [Acidobacteria bacterium ACB2]
MYRQGMSLRQIGEREGVTASSVLAALRKAGVKLRPARAPKGPWPIAYLDEAIKLRAKGLTLAEIGARVGRTGEAVRLVLRRRHDFPR